MSRGDLDAIKSGFKYGQALCGGRATKEFSGVGLECQSFAGNLGILGFTYEELRNGVKEMAKAVDTRSEER